MGICMTAFRRLGLCEGSYQVPGEEIKQRGNNSNDGEAHCPMMPQLEVEYLHENS